MIEEQQGWLYLLPFCFIWFIVWFVLIARRWNSVEKSIGLIFLFLIDHTMSYLGGAFSFFGPDPDTYFDIAIVFKGFRLATIGMVGFLFGAASFNRRLTGPIIKTFGRVKISERMRSLLPRFCFFCGLIFYFIVGPLTEGIKGIYSTVSVLLQMLPIGMSLLALQYLQEGRRSRFFLVFSSAFVLPVLTVLRFGFLGQGFNMALTVFMLVARNMRNKMRVLVMLSLIGYLGLSVYQTYMRERLAIRAVIWSGEASAQDRFQATFKMFDNIEWFNPSDAVQIKRISGRIDMNFIVGSIVDYLEKGRVPFADGETIFRSVIGIVPRIFWPGKPIIMGGSALVYKYTGMQFDEETSVAHGLMGELYFNFGILGVFVGMLLFGMLLGTIDTVAGVALAQKDYLSMVFWLLWGLVLVYTQSFAHFFSVSGCAVLGGLIVVKFLKSDINLWVILGLLLFVARYIFG